jgi:hypothetical protein
MHGDDPLCCGAMSRPDDMGHQFECGLPFDHSGDHRIEGEAGWSYATWKDGEPAQAFPNT